MDRQRLAVYAEKYKDAVFRAAYSYTHNHADSEDITQETFLRLLKSEKEFKSDENAKAWLLRVAINLSKDYLRSSWFRKRDELDEGIIQGSQEQLQLDEAMSNLSPIIRTAVCLHYYLGYSVKETAGLLGISESNVKIRLKRGRDSLKEFLEEEKGS